jgi:hypothetical protein
MREARIAFLVALGLLAIAVGVVLSGSPPSVTRAKAPLLDASALGTLGSGAQLCQGGEVLPRGTSAIRVWLEAVIGPPVTLTARQGSRLLTSGRRGAGWSTGSVTIPVRPISHRSSGVSVCVLLGRAREPVDVVGVSAPPADAAYNAAHQSAGGRVMIEYLRPGGASWLSLARSAARRMGLGHAIGGAWVALAALAAMCAAAAMISWLVLRGLA